MLTLTNRPDGFEEQLAEDYLRYDFNLGKLIEHIGIEEVERVIAELKKDKD